MILTDAQRLALFGQVLAAIVQRQIWPKHPPKRKDGTLPDAVGEPFAMVCWADRITNAAVYVLEQQGGGGQGQADDQGQSASVEFAHHADPVF